MKKLAVCTLLLAASALLFACGPSNQVNENTNPEDVKSETLSQKDWERVCGTHERFSVKTTVCEQSENGDTMSEIATYFYSQKGDEGFLTYMQKQGEESVQGEIYLKLGEQISMWERAQEDGEWSEWQHEDYATEDFAYFDILRGQLGFAAQKYGDFTYNEVDKGYVSEGEKLTFADDVVARCASVLAQIDGDCSAKKVVIKANGGNPAACILHFEAAEETVQRMEPRFFIEHLDFKIPRLDFFGIHRTGHWQFGVPVPIREVATARTVTRVQIGQVYYAFGSAEVTTPANLPASEG